MRHTLLRHVSGPTYANTAAVAGLFLAALFLLYRQTILVALGWTADVAHIAGASFQPVTTPEAVAAHYIYPRQPPPRFKEWLHFAQLKRCELRQYDHIEQDLDPFRRLVADGGAEALQAAVGSARKLGDTATFTIKGGKVYVRHRGRSIAAYAAGVYQEMIETIADRLPDVRFVVNLLDEPRVLLGPGSVHERYASATCANASADFHEFRHLHSFVISPASQVTDANTTLPIFSQTKIRGCHTDIMLPSHYNLKSQAVRWHDTPPWHRRKPVLYWRGSTTGGTCNDNTPFWNMHRQRLVGFSKNHSDMDMAIVDYIQCSKKCCTQQEAKYGLAKRVRHKENWKHRYLMILDGNSFNSRLPTFLSSGSLLFRAGLFGEWFDERIHPMKHYLPTQPQVRLDFSDLRERLDWAQGHNQEAHLIADAARRVAHHRLRYQDIQCYMYRLLLEYAALFGNATVPDPKPLKAPRQLGLRNGDLERQP